MKLEKRFSWFNPYCINDREIKEILFFDKEGVICKTRSGWFEVRELKRDDGSTILFDCGNNERGAFEIEGLDLVNKRIFDPKLLKAQLIPIKPKYNFEKKDKPSSLYIPYDIMEFKITLDHKQLKLDLKTYHYDLVWSDKYKVGFYTHSAIEETPNTEEIAVWNKVKPFYELLTGKEEKYTPMGFSRNFDKIREIADRWL